MLVTSSVPIGFADTIPQIDSSLSDESPIQSSTQSRKTISVSIEENIGLSSGSPIKNAMNNVVQYIDSFSKLAYLNEDLKLLTSSAEQKIHFNLIHIQPQTIVERISQTDKLRDDRKKNSKIETFYLDDTFIIYLCSKEKNISQLKK